jgi:methylthioribose-1-phosphate isomerase
MSAEEEPTTKKAKTTDSSMNLQSLIYSNDGGSNPRLEVLDQLLVPHEKVYISVPDVETAYNVIQTMQIRGGL